MNARRKSPPRSNRNEPVAVTECLHALPLAARAARHADLDRRFQVELPPTWAGHITLAGIRAERAVLITTSSAWATRARLQQAQLRDILRRLGQQVAAITIKVVPPAVDAPCAPQPDLSLTPAAAAHLRAAAAATPDPELRARYLALASMADPPPR